jgi:FKBP-type peptidyl-prolyl cis-trans isomerase SlyD
MTQSISSGCVVGYHFTMKNAAGVVLGEATGGDISYYLHGAENIPPGLEKHMSGRTVGDTFETEVLPEEAFGERQEVEPMEVPRSGFGDADLEAGVQVVAETPDGNEVLLWICEVTDESVMLDPNHPLAGETLHFTVEVVSIRDATDEEKEHGHPHEGDHHHH